MHSASESELGEERMTANSNNLIFFATAPSFLWPPLVLRFDIRVYQKSTDLK